MLLLECPNARKSCGSCYHSKPHVFRENCNFSYCPHGSCECIDIRKKRKKKLEKLVVFNNKSDENR